MPKKKFALERGGPKRLDVSWKMSWKDLKVDLDGRTILEIPDSKALKEGRSTVLEDGSTLSVTLGQSLLSPVLEISRNGEPLPGTAADPEYRLQISYGIIYFVAALSALGSIVTIVFEIQFLAQLGMGWGSLVFAAILGILGWLTQRRSMVALVIAILLFALDAIFSTWIVLSQEGATGIGGLVFRVFLLVGMIQGVPALRELKSTPRL